MGVTFLTVRVSNPAKPNKARDVEFLVDSGALYTVLPGSELKSLGIEPTSTEEFTLGRSAPPQWRMWREPRPGHAAGAPPPSAAAVRPAAEHAGRS